MTICGTCGAENQEGHKFCSNCGNSLALTCPSCSTENDPGNRFCFNCGTPLDGDTSPSPDTSAKPKTERRFVSVLFADLVSFTTFSEHRDSEDVRSMLTDYFERSREIIERYGGEVDKFIGDAVMGVWGAVAAHEDDAERATRAALELVTMVSDLGREIGVPELQLRAGVLSGDTAVGPAGNDKGLVVGDLVNTASRLQSIAPPGGVYIGRPTKDLIEGRIEVSAEGDHEVKGKDAPIAAYQAIRVIADQGRRASDMLEGPFVGRDDELRALKDQLHATGRDGRARLVSVVGEGGIGKTRLSQELLRYIDGISDDIYYHHGRSPAYGDGVTFWALGEMVRQRAGIAETDEPSKARMKLRTMVADFAPEEDDQRWIEQRLAALIGLGEMPEGERSELFAALRTFFQKIAERGTVLMVFEDLHWADDGLLDFIDELVERTVRHPVLVITLARPEILEKRQDWGSSRKRSMSMHLSRIDDDAMRELVAGLAPGLPPDMVERIAERTAGVPLHAVEFVRMLINSGRLIRDDDGFRYEGTDDDLTIPDSVSAIIGARLDRLDPDELALVQDASVLGLSFTIPSLAAMRDESVASVEPILRDLVRQELLEYDEDPRSPERGQYRFVQGLILEVAYGRLTRSKKVDRHLAIASHLEATGDVEVAGVIASHYEQAAAADPANEELAVRARDAIIAAAERATSLHSHMQAMRLHDQAISLTPPGADRALLLIRRSRAAYLTGADDSTAAAIEALEWFREDSDETGIRAAATEIAFQLVAEFRATEALAVILPVYEKSEMVRTPEWGRLASETSRALMLADQPDRAIEVADAALDVLEEFEDIKGVIEMLINKGTALGNSGHEIEGRVILRGAGELAAEHELTAQQIRALNNYNAVSISDDQASLIPQQAVDLIDKLGDVSWEVRARYFGGMTLVSHGRFDDALAEFDKMDPDNLSSFWAGWFEHARLTVDNYRTGPDAVLHRRIMEILEPYAATDDPQLAENVQSYQALALLEAGDFAAAVNVGSTRHGMASSYDFTGEISLIAAAWADDPASVHSFAERLAGSTRGRAARGLWRFAAAAEAALNGDLEEAEVHYRSADDLWTEAGAPLNHAVMRATMAKIIGPDTALGREAGSAAKEFFEKAGSKLHLSLFAEALPKDDTALDESSATA